MHLFKNRVIKIIFFSYLLFVSVNAISENCSFGHQGICFQVSTCAFWNGTSDPGDFCPFDIIDVQCCSDIPCKSIRGYCDWITNPCPGGYNSGEYLDDFNNPCI